MLAAQFRIPKDVIGSNKQCIMANEAMSTKKKQLRHDMALGMYFCVSVHIYVYIHIARTYLSACV